MRRSSMVGSAATTTRDEGAISMGTVINGASDHYHWAIRVAGGDFLDCPTGAPENVSCHPHLTAAVGAGLARPRRHAVKAPGPNNEEAPPQHESRQNVI